MYLFVYQWSCLLILNKVAGELLDGRQIYWKSTPPKVFFPKFPIYFQFLVKSVEGCFWISDAFLFLHKEVLVQTQCVKLPNTEFFLFCIFPYLDWVFGLSVFSPNIGAYGPEKNYVFGHFSRSESLWEAAGHRCLEE